MSAMVTGRSVAKVAEEVSKQARPISAVELLKVKFMVFTSLSCQ
jgi:hypothetical protein